MYGLTFDIIIVAILLVFGILSSFKGFFKSLTSLLGSGFAIAITYLLKNQILDLDKSIGIASAISNTLGENASKIIALIIYGAIIYVILRLIALILNMTVGKIFKSEILNGLNKFLGFLFGFIKGGLLCLAILFTISGLTLLPSFNDFITPKLQGSYIAGPVVLYLRENVIDEMINSQSTDDANNPVVSM